MAITPWSCHPCQLEYYPCKKNKNLRAGNILIGGSSHLPRMLTWPLRPFRPFRPFHPFRPGHSEPKRCAKSCRSWPRFRAPVDLVKFQHQPRQIWLMDGILEFHHQRQHIVIWYHGFQTMTETLPGGPHLEADASAPFHSKLGSVNWASQLIGTWALSQVATVGGRLNDCENFKKTLVGVQWYSVHVSQTALSKQWWFCGIGR